MTTEIALDLMLIVLLCTTVGYCVVLNKRLTRLRDGQSEFKELVETLTAATDKAETSLKELRELTDATSAELSKNIGTARELADELSMITESGNALANRIEARLTGGQASAAASSKDQAETAPKKLASTAKETGEDDVESPPKSEVEKELLSMLRNVR